MKDFNVAVIPSLFIVMIPFIVAGAFIYQHFEDQELEEQKQATIVNCGSQSVMYQRKEEWYLRKFGSYNESECRGNEYHMTCKDVPKIGWNTIHVASSREEALMVCNNK